MTFSTGFFFGTNFTRIHFLLEPNNINSCISCVMSNDWDHVYTHELTHLLIKGFQKSSDSNIVLHGCFCSFFRPSPDFIWLTHNDNCVWPIAALNLSMLDPMTGKQWGFSSVPRLRCHGTSILRLSSRNRDIRTMLRKTVGTYRCWDPTHAGRTL